MGQQFDIFEQNVEQAIKLGIINLLDSYHHPWDFIAELCQNAIDAVREKAADSKRSYKPQIKINVNTSEKTFEIIDNGIGMTQDQVKKALLPNVSFKRDKQTKVRPLGYKGLGLSFVVFSRNYFEVETVNEQEKTLARYENAHKWVQDEAGKVPRPKLNFDVQRTNADSSTRVKVSFEVEGDSLPWGNSAEELIHTLRTKTALGVFDPLIEGDTKDEVDVELTYDEKLYKVESSYWHPSACVDPSRLITLPDLKNLLANNKKPSRRLRAIVHSGSDRLTPQGKRFRYHLLFCEVEVYDEIAKEHKLPFRKEINGDTIPGAFEPGIYLSIDGMPSGVRLGFPERTGQEGDWRKLYIVVDVEDLKLDAGRKSISIRDQKAIHKKVTEIWRELLNYREYIITKTDEPIRQIVKTQQLHTRLDTAKQQPQLRCPYISFERVPQSEQGVIAIFYELIGAQKLKGYNTLDISTDEQYDALVNYHITLDSAIKSPKDKFGIGAQAIKKYASAHHKKAEKMKELNLYANVEFKYRLESIIKDIEDQEKPKYWDDLHLIVAWDAGNVIKKGDWMLEKVDDAERLFYGQQYELTPPRSYVIQPRPVPVILLKELLEVLGELENN